MLIIRYLLLILCADFISVILVGHWGFSGVGYIWLVYLIFIHITHIVLTKILYERSVAFLNLLIWILFLFYFFPVIHEMLMYICSNFDFLYKDTIKTVISKFNNIDKGILDITQHSDKNLLQKELDSKKLELAQLTDKQKLYITDAEINQLLSKIQMAQSDIDSLESDINKHEPDYVRSFLLFLICVLLFYNTYYLTVKRSFTRQQQLQQQQREMLARLRNELSILKWRDRGLDIKLSNRIEIVQRNIDIIVADLNDTKKYK